MPTNNCTDIHTCCIELYFLLYFVPRNACSHVFVINVVQLVQFAINLVVTLLGFVPTCVTAINVLVLVYVLCRMLREPCCWPSLGICAPFARVSLLSPSLFFFFLSDGECVLCLFPHYFML